jgi:hypothetical protein
MMGVRTPETCWAVFKCQVINLWNCCIWLVDSVESMIMHGLANPKNPVSITGKPSLFISKTKWNTLTSFMNKMEIL